MKHALLLSIFTVLFALPSWALTAEQEAKLLPADGAAHHYFGLSVALHGDTAIIGAHGDDNGYESGSAYVFYRDQGGPDSWGQAAKLTALDGTADDLFGHAVSIPPTAFSFDSKPGTEAIVLCTSSGLIPRLGRRFRIVDSAHVKSINVSPISSVPMQPEGS